MNPSVSSPIETEVDITIGIESSGSGIDGSGSISGIGRDFSFMGYVM
jgi:hypothetical protein